MVFFNYATMQMAAKIVYYGPGLCGKTTNLHHIYAKTSPQSRGEMVSLETETDRTLFFDLLPIDVGVIGGFKTRLQLYTIPGQVFYNTTRKLVLKGVDGIVFVADSQTAMLEANVESFKNLKENLAEIGLTVDEIPLVVQLNKRDLPNISDPDAILSLIDPERKYEFVEAVAYAGTGVFETLKLISKLTLRTLRRRMTGEEPVKPASRATGQFKVREDTGPIAPTPIPTPAPSPARTMAGQTPLPPVSSTFVSPTAAQTQFISTPAATASQPVAEAEPEVVQRAQTAVEIEPPPPEPEVAPYSAPAGIDANLLEDVPVAEVPVAVPEPIEPEPIPEPEPAAPPAAAAAPPPPVAEPEIDFSQTDKPVKPQADVKTVKVRSSVDVMAELEALRKRATNVTPKPAKKESPSIAELAMPKPKRDITKTLSLPVAPGVLPRTRSLRVTVSFEDEVEGVVQTQDQTVELGDTADVQSLSVNLKFDLA